MFCFGDHSPPVLFSNMPMNLEMAQLLFSKELSCFKVIESMHDSVFVCVPLCVMYV